MNFNSTTEIEVSICFDTDTQLVGQLAKRDHEIYFEYDARFIQQGIEISPFQCALQPGLQIFDTPYFEGLPGVFNDSLPDGWGRLLLNRQMQSLGIMPQELSVLDRLAYVGQMGMGALVYKSPNGPPDTASLPKGTVDIDMLASQIKQVLSGDVTDVLAQLLQFSGSSGGARPKATIGLHKNRTDAICDAQNMQDGYEPWLVKFPNTNDGEDAGAIEYVYALMAKEAGVVMPDVHLFPAPEGSGYFAVQRFDRNNNQRLHMHTACGLLHSDFRAPLLDYRDLLELTNILTRDMREVEKMYRWAVFNVLAHNRDDHSKNFSFLMDKSGEWKASPAYDLTYSSGPGGEQSTMVLGNGKNPGADALTELGLQAKISNKSIATIIEQTRAALSQWPELAKNYGVSRDNIKLIASRIKALDA